MFLCDFHREQAWERWLTKHTNGMADKKEEVLTMMRNVARASTVEEYECRLEELQASPNWSRKESHNFNICNNFNNFNFAFATSLVNGISPEDETFSVEELRPHLLKCLQEGKMKPFPRESEITHKRVRPTTTVKLNLYCHCRMPWRPSDKEVRGMAMAECEICLKWFHQKCENIPDSIFRDGGSWTCNDCTARN